MEEVNEHYKKISDSRFRFNPWYDPSERIQIEKTFDITNRSEDDFKRLFPESSSNAAEFAYKHKFGLQYFSHNVPTSEEQKTYRKELRAMFIGSDSLYDIQHWFKIRIDPNQPPVWAQLRMSSHPVSLGEWYNTHVKDYECCFGLSLKFTDNPDDRSNPAPCLANHRITIYEGRVGSYTDYDFLDAFVDDVVAGNEPEISLNDIAKYIDPNYKVISNNLTNELDPQRNKPEQKRLYVISPCAFTADTQPAQLKPVPNSLKLSEITELDANDKFEYEGRTYHFDLNNMIATTTINGARGKTITKKVKVLDESKSHRTIPRRSPGALNESTTNINQNRVIVRSRHI